MITILLLSWLVFCSLLLAIDEIRALRQERSEWESLCRAQDQTLRGFRVTVSNLSLNGTQEQEQKREH